MCGGISLAIQWLRLYAPKEGGIVSILGQGTKILHATWNNQKFKKKNVYSQAHPLQWGHSVNKLYVPLSVGLKHRSPFMQQQAPAPSSTM